jgi:hypothetical protein
VIAPGSREEISAYKAGLCTMCGVAPAQRPSSECGCRTAVYVRPTVVGGVGAFEPLDQVLIAATAALLVAGDEKAGARLFYAVHELEKALRTTFVSTAPEQLVSQK